ncbi:MAG: 30S ribosomal protein S9 [Nanoarchaeota archaeon]|nr:30S ribosomal protein S9 [Nanoarchaeota archaeon]MBU1269914.1 30S ribosomal protein S9 [Nanoarchaeota archaeon]MBU1604155.1 30S ribosomal protein S9 [Nanoarchaeota archaeon]MBU2442498.1 30S ribosomal protein S9 [Nanoarchaeota archaeon]
MNKIIHFSGKRKRAIARATLKPGKGIVRINKIHIENYEPKLARVKIQEPLFLAKEYTDKVDINVSVKGGGVISQADAARLAIGRVLVKHNSRLKELFIGYDRQLLVADVRRKECSKPNSHGQARAKTQKSYR